MCMFVYMHIFTCNMCLCIYTHKYVGIMEKHYHHSQIKFMNPFWKSEKPIEKPLTLIRDLALVTCDRICENQ